MQPRITSASSLFYAKTNAEDDLPPYVRGGSSLRLWRGQLVIAQDDIAALAVVDPENPAQTRAILLPRGEGGRRTFGPSLGNKAAKLDLEASVVLPDGRYVALGSGSTEARQMLVVLQLDESVTLFDGAALYAHLRERTDFSGVELNIEGALIVGDDLWLFQRGNSVESQSAMGRLALVDFVAWLDGAPSPQLLAVQRVDLGTVRGVPYGYTDAAICPNGDIYVLSSAEDTPNAYDDGDILGSVLTRLAFEEARGAVRLFESGVIVDGNGQPTRRKLEGLEYHSGGANGEPLRFWAVTDDDDESAATELLVITLK